MVTADINKHFNPSSVLTDDSTLQTNSVVVWIIAWILLCNESYEDRLSPTVSVQFLSDILGRRWQTLWNAHEKAYDKFLRKQPLRSTSSALTWARPISLILVNANASIYCLQGIMPLFFPWASWRRIILERIWQLNIYSKKATEAHFSSYNAVSFPMISV